MNPQRTRYCVAAAVIVAPSSCVGLGPHDVQVEVNYDAPGQAPSLEDVVLISGGDKASRSMITPGERVRVVLKPNGAPPQLTMQWHVATKERTWVGPKFPDGRSYKIWVTVDSRGRVTEKH